MRKDKFYKRAKFLPETIRSAASRLLENVPEEKRQFPPYETMQVTLGEEVWRHDSEAEFFEDYRKNASDATFSKSYLGFVLSVSLSRYGTNVDVGASTRSAIQNVHSIFEEAYQAAIQPEPPQPLHRPRVFIGHGRNTLWRDLKDHLHEQHGYEVEAYEIGARAGHSIRDILDEMLKKSSFALLVMTGEDETAEGTLHPRLNVVHECGLFQGRLGFHRAIVLLEDGAEDFSNIAGVHQLRFSKGQIREIYGDVVATLRREFE
jgi:predicted nucleotide-binding protein